MCARLMSDGGSWSREVVAMMSVGGECSRHLHGGGGVDFDEPGLEVLVDQNIVAEHLEAVGAVRDAVLRGTKGLDHHL